MNTKRIIKNAQAAFLKWQTHARAETRRNVRRLGNALREAKHGLGRLVTLEAGKITPKAKAKFRR